MEFGDIYRKHYKNILAIPFILVFVFAYLAFVNPGLKMGIDFRGGILVSFSSDEPVDVQALEDAIKSELGVSDASVTPVESIEGGKTVYGAIIEVVYPEEVKAAEIKAEATGEEAAIVRGETEEKSQTELFKARVLDIITKTVPTAKEITVRDVTPSLGATFWGLAVNIAFWAFVLLFIVVFLFFRKGIPTAIMIGSAVFDALGMLALMAVFNIPLTLSTITILLMMVGYSIDTDIVLSTHLLKRGKEEGDEFDRAGRAASTGLHMSGTTLVAMLFIYVVGYLTRNLTVMRIANVMIFGVLADIVVTWLLNAPVMIMWVRKHASSA